MKGVSITMPEDVFSLKGIFSITMQVLNLGWQGIRAIGSKVIGEPIMKALDTGADNVGGKQAANEKSFPENMKQIGPLSVGSRLYYLRKQMMMGLSKKWAENKWTYIGIGAAVVLGITALAIATAGAIFTLIPPALQILAAVMLGAAIVKASGFFKQFMIDGWAGNVLSAAKSLARAIAIILVELIFILLFDSAALFKVLKTTAKSGVKGALKLGVAGAKATGKGLATGVKATGKGVVKQAGKAKFLVKNTAKGTVKRAKNFNQWGKNLAKKFKFKGFKIVLNGKRFKLYGQTNPWVLLATGDVKHIDKSQLKKGQKLGDDIQLDGVDAILIGTQDTKVISPLGKTLDNTAVTGGRSVRATAARSLDENKKFFKDIQKIKLDNKTLPIKDLRKKITAKLNANSGTELRSLKTSIKKEIADRKAAGLKPTDAFPAKYEAHHIIPKEMEVFFGKVFDDLGINLDTAINAIMLPPVKEFDEAIDMARKSLNPGDIPANFWKRAKHQTHPDYNLMIRNDLKILFEGFEHASKADKKVFKEELLNLISRHKESLETLTDMYELKILQ